MSYYKISNIYKHLKNPQKYKGKLPITCRSGWEIKFVMNFLDKHPSILEWTSESVVIPYYFPIDNKMHRYFMDFSFKALLSDNTIKEYLVEIKPYKETMEPTTPKRKTKGFYNQVFTYQKNKAKWDATKIMVENLRKQGKNIEFQIITEKDAEFFVD